MCYLITRTTRKLHLVIEKRQKLLRLIKFFKLAATALLPFSVLDLQIYYKKFIKI